jgi:glucan phosphoethanolaminetransferase (alkaline phosphatase superfamily)
MSYNYFKSKFYISLLVSAILIALIFFLVEFKRNTLILTGSLLAVSGLLFAKLSIFASFISDENLLSILSIIFTQAYKIFLITFILGIVLIGVGIGLKIWGSRQDSNSKVKRK